ncbi:hypothetical protein ACFXAE_09000 [Streptomyces sp. NPDC059454]|uniref:hypothetical protein n=1 Tax=Streptomyces sp. NPDC059454 TaxID=3346836 RepID=UPI003696C4C2
MSDELADALRELAAQHETPPRVGAAEVRARAGRRSRRRRAAAALGTVATAACVLAAVAFTPHTGEPGRNGRTPAAAPDAASDAPTPAPSTAAPVPASAGVLDLGRHTLTVGERVLRVDSHSFRQFPPGSRMTVVAKADGKLLRLESGTKSGAEIKVPYLVELRTPDRQPVYAGALAFDTKALAALSAGTGWLGMSPTDAEWFYTRARTGDRIEITSTVTPGATATTTTPTGAETAPTGAESAATLGTADHVGPPAAGGGTDG